MKTIIEKTSLPEVIVVTSEIYRDNRGFITEIFRADQYHALGLPQEINQVNHSGSIKNTIRGLHFQIDPPNGKFMRVIRGEAFLVAVDIRLNSPTFGKHVARIFSDENNPQLMWAPAGFARGFAAISDYVEIEYLMTGIYNPNTEDRIFWNDPALGIKWPIKNPIVSDKDSSAMTLAEWNRLKQKK